MAYSDYTFYRDEYKGVVAEEVYTRLLPRATAEIDRMTFNRARTASGDSLTAVKFAECAVVEELNYQGTSGAGDVTSESNDGISRSYSSGIAKTARQRINAAADTYLTNTGLCAVPI
jgi:hypothetical protein